MKAFVRISGEDGWDVLTIAAIVGTMMFAAEELGEVAYVPLMAFMAICLARQNLRPWQRARALLGADRNKGSR